LVFLCGYYIIVIVFFVATYRKNRYNKKGIILIKIVLIGEGDAG